MSADRNAQRTLDALMAALALEGRRPSLLLHSCCAPCSSAVLERLCEQFRVTVYYYNPNIHPDAEYEKRKAEQIRLLREYALMGREVRHIDAEYDPDAFFMAAKGLELEPEGGSRCTECFSLRLHATARAARRGLFEYFGTTLSVSPHKDAGLINALGADIARQYAPVRYLTADFKKQGGYQRSIELSKRYGLYRQRYCGCAYSLDGRAYV